MGRYAQEHTHVCVRILQTLTIIFGCPLYQDWVGFPQNATHVPALHLPLGTLAAPRAEAVPSLHISSNKQRLAINIY